MSFLKMGIFLIALTGKMSWSEARKQPQEFLREICARNGLFLLKKKSSLNFTFNVRLPHKDISRKWQWDMADNKIFLEGKEVGRTPVFINDIYWLVFPLMVWDSQNQVNLALREGVYSPLTNLPTTELKIAYISGAGKTPNDIYKIYVDSLFQIREWAYFKGGQEPAARITTWEGYRELNQVHLSLERAGPDGFRVFFTDVNLQNTDSP